LFRSKVDSILFYLQLKIQFLLQKILIQTINSMNINFKMEDLILLKLGGEVIRKNLDNVLNQIGFIAEKIILIHGGREIVNEYSLKVGIEPKFVTSPEGIKSRYTSLDELEIYVMTMNLINKKITSILNSKGVPSIGISGVDGNLILAKKKDKIVILNEKGRKQIIDGGYTGKITKINVDLMNKLLNCYRCIVVSPIALDLEKGCMLNVDSDQVAAEIAKAMKISKIIFLTDVNGLKINENYIRTVKLSEIPALLSKTGFGMNRKLMMIYEAMKNGVNEVIIANGLSTDFLKEIENGNATKFLS
ncbi:MAG: [LysW]-aminoadipate/[LysW]-glutamate kinase, partial [Thermoproteota archaeon]